MFIEIMFIAVFERKNNNHNCRWGKIHENICLEVAEKYITEGKSSVFFILQHG